jgi:polyadenylate-binding protein
MPGSPISPTPTLHSQIMRQASTSSSESESHGESERDRFLVALRPVAKFAREAEQLADLLMSLSKKDRALCLFNPDHMMLKVADARTVLAAVESPFANQAYPTPRATPDTRSEAKFNPNEPAWTLSTLAALPSGQIVDLVQSDNPPVCAARVDSRKGARPTRTRT